MNKNRMTVEELNSLKPSYDNPVELECDNGFYKDSRVKIKVITPVISNEFALINLKGVLWVDSSDKLENYPSLKQPKTKKMYCYLIGPVITSKYLAWYEDDTLGHTRVPSEDKEITID